MGYILFMIVMLLCVFAFYRISSKMKPPAVPLATTDAHKKEQKIIAGARFGFRAAMWVFLAVAIMVSVFSSYNQVPAGYVGVVYQFGAIKDQITEGLNFIQPWRSMKLANVQTQGHVFDKLVCFSTETQEVFVKATLNLNVSPQAIQRLYRTVGPNWFNVLVAPRVQQNFKDETVKYPSLDIAPNREKIRVTVRARLEKELSPHSIEVSDLLLDNIDFDPNFKKSIENKQIATQKALEEKEKIKGETAKADQAIETAKGAAEAVLINANKQAAANDKLAKSLTPELIQYTMIQKLAPNISVMMIPSNQSMIMSPEMFQHKK
jgi:prohibitin 2